MKRRTTLGGMMLGTGLTLAAIAVAQPAPPAQPAAPAKKPAAPADPNAVKPVPAPATQPIPAAQKEALEKGLAELTGLIEDIKKAHAGKTEVLARLPDVQIYANAVRYPLTYNDVLDPKQGLKLLADGIERAKLLKDGKHPWTEQSGPRGYVSKIDGSVQPYMLWVPPKWKPGSKDPLPLAFNCHGRNEKLTEAVFLSGKPEGVTTSGTIGDPSNKFAVGLYGRFCCANKMAGEIDLFEAWDDVKKQYPIDENRVAVTGFSMGGGAVWHLAAHYGEKWVCATPGAGFSESERFLRLKENGEVPPWYESALYHLYNATDVAENFYNCKTISYAGDKDGQKQAGDVAEEAMAKIGLKLERFVGPNTGHAYEKETKKRLDARVEELVQKGREATPKRVWFSTYSLRYPSMKWVTVTGLEHHWRKATVDAEVVEPAGAKVATTNVTSFVLMPHEAGLKPGPEGVSVTVDGTRVVIPVGATPPGAAAVFAKKDGQWSLVRPGKGEEFFPKGEVRKTITLRGPIDDAFYDSFLVVKPAAAAADKPAAWAAGECDHAVTDWRRQFRGEARVKAPADVTDADIAAHNLVLFGTPETNPLIAKVLPKLPIQWTKEKLVVNGQEFDGGRYVPVMIYPNPLNPAKYVVLNSGFTFREADYLNNARQTPKLPDYAVVDTQSPPGPRGWGKLPKAGFFGERWEWQKDDGKIE